MLSDSTIFCNSTSLTHASSTVPYVTHYSPPILPTALLMAKRSTWTVMATGRFVPAGLVGVAGGDSGGWWLAAGIASGGAGGRHGQGGRPGCLG
jgi:hypothetical protein